MKGGLGSSCSVHIFLFWVPRFLFFSQSSGISFSSICFSSVRNCPALFPKHVSLVKISFFIFSSTFYPSLSFLPALISRFDLTSKDLQRLFCNIYCKALWEKNKNKEVRGGTMEGMDGSAGKWGTEALWENTHQLFSQSPRLSPKDEGTERGYGSSFTGEGAMSRSRSERWRKDYILYISTM